MKKIVISFIVILLISLFTWKEVGATSKFPDVPANHYAKQAIDWAVEQKIISGYPNGKFGPSDYVTEEQLIKMLAEALNIPVETASLEKITKDAKWSDTYYNRFALYEAPLKGYTLNTLRSSTVTRGQFAQIIALLLTNNTNLTDAIHFLVNEGITSGVDESKRNTNIHSFFGTKQSLTRAQTVVFLQRLNAKNMAAVEAKDDGQSLNEQAKRGTNKIDEIAMSYGPAIKKVFQTKPLPFYSGVTPMINRTGDLSIISDTQRYERFNTIQIYSKKGELKFYKTNITVPFDTFEAYLSGNQLILDGYNNIYTYNQSFKKLSQKKRTTEVEFEGYKEPVTTNKLTYSKAAQTVSIHNKSTGKLVASYKVDPQTVGNNFDKQFAYLEKGQYFAIFYEGTTDQELQVVMFRKNGEKLSQYTIQNRYYSSTMTIYEDGTLLLYQSDYSAYEDNYYQAIYETFALNGVKTGETRFDQRTFERPMEVSAELMFVSEKKFANELNSYIFYDLTRAK